MILAFELCEAEIKPGSGVVVYTNRCALFDSERMALEVAKDKDEIGLIDCDTGKIIKDANIAIETMVNIENEEGSE